MLLSKLTLVIIDNCQSFNERLQKQMEEGNAKWQHMKLLTEISRSGRQASVVGARIYVDHGVCIRVLQLWEWKKKERMRSMKYYEKREEEIRCLAGDHRVYILQSGSAVLTMDFSTVAQVKWNRDLQNSNTEKTV